MNAVLAYIQLSLTPSALAIGAGRGEPEMGVRRRVVAVTTENASLARSGDDGSS